MRKNVLLPVFLLFFIACNSPSNPKIEKPIIEEDNSLITVVEGEKLFTVDTSKIFSFSDYDRVKTELFVQYDKLKTEAFNNYYDKKTDVFNIYQKEKDYFISVIRNNHRDLYLKWLDAKKIRDHQEIKRIENMPEFSEYKVFSEEGYLEYQRNEKHLYDEYIKERECVYNEYTRKRELAFETYRSKKTD
ncbi:MAG: hypothetical protein WC280_00640 [Patescibacteria group bacterium]